jgi:hypothetical protein
MTHNRRVAAINSAQEVIDRIISTHFSKKGEMDDE